MAGFGALGQARGGHSAEVFVTKTLDGVESCPVAVEVVEVGLGGFVLRGGVVPVGTIKLVAVVMTTEENTHGEHREKEKRTETLRHGRGP